MTLAFTYVHQVSVKTYLGTGSNNVRKFADPAPVDCYVMDEVEIVRDNNGQEVTSTTQLNAPLGHAPNVPATAGQFAPASEVTLPSGRVATVIKAARHDSGALNLGLDHVHVYIT